MSKKLSAILLSILFAILGLWIWSFATPKKSIILGGSTSINPIMQKITEAYYKKNKFEFIYNSTGSQAGVSGVEKNMYSIGFISKDISDKTLKERNKFLNLAEEKKLKNNLKKLAFEKIDTPIKSKSEKESYIALEFAIDAIGIIYNPPTYWNKKIPIAGLEKDLSINDLVNFNLTKENKNGKKIIADIYAEELGWKELATEFLKPYKDKTDSSGKNIYTEFSNLISNQENTKIITYTREDGSGTRSAFSDLTGVKNMQAANVVNSNFSMLDQIERSTGIGYISKAFLTKFKEDGDVKLAGIDYYKLPIGKSDDPLFWEGYDWKIWKPENRPENESNTDNFIKSDFYKFKRSFIGIFNSYDPKYKYLMELFDFINTQVDDLLKSEGLVKNMFYKWPDK